MKKVLSVLMAFCLIFSLCACDFANDIVDSTLNIKAKSKTFEFDGLSIELTTEFLRMDFVSEDYDFIVGTETLTLMGMKIVHTETDLGELPVIEFARNFRSRMLESNPTAVTEIDGIPTMQYTAGDEGEKQTIAVMFYKNDDCFWVLCFGASSEDFNEEYDNICKYAKTVKC